MLSRFSRFLFALAALAPVTFVWLIVDFENQGFQVRQIYVLIFSLVVFLFCWELLVFSQKSLSRISFDACEVKSVDNEVVAYVVAYLFPLFTYSDRVNFYSQICVFILLAIVLSTSNAFTFNPLLTILGYRFYEIKNKSGVTYLLVSKCDITDVDKVKFVGRISKHLLLHLD